MTLLQHNLAKVRELREDVQWAGIAWCNYCDQVNLQFRILEAYRTQARQESLYAQGRSKPGPIVTYTRNSLHTKRLAVDVQPINCTHEQVAEVARTYGITHPFAWDKPHYEFDKVRPRAYENIDPRVRLRGLKRRLAQEKDLSTQRLLLQMIRPSTPLTILAKLVSGELDRVPEDFKIPAVPITQKQVDLLERRLRNAKDSTMRGIISRLIARLKQKLLLQ